jgi:hypothetical protein
MRRLKGCIGLHRNNLKKKQEKMAIIGPQPVVKVCINIFTTEELEWKQTMCSVSKRI